MNQDESFPNPFSVSIARVYLKPRLSYSCTIIYLSSTGLSLVFDRFKIIKLRRMQENGNYKVEQALAPLICVTSSNFFLFIFPVIFFFLFFFSKTKKFILRFTDAFP